ncbi:MULTISPECIES: TIGR01459 family HAD-type hydrolase [unclassified Bradyrhizobium]|uniref:TIGR01459 family HAD-type hydrolase n=1 Tax=unclassified Bradyrhizobium TaxID=2631580 RepID=UPI002478D2EE|nr:MULTISPECIES: TIGR01459 family HAD-type hydrolase [unclassified Bradyrhizobium]WGS18133.1 TIGR01459 family HAD-type hydrolase [Bradyrhizobium sp. ISRA463]WGS24947.1 TIGR01459 family HAD-type hydrolase [Bradyrhizobium sp. ISRA464]
MRDGPIEIAGLGTIIEHFDHVLLDQWGTLHEGRSIIPSARECVARLRDAGKRVLVLSNSGKRAHDNAQRLASLGLPTEAYDGILTSGEVAWIGLKARKQAPFIELGHACFLVTRGGDRTIVDGLDLDVVADMENADFILLAGLDDAAAEPEQWRQCLTRAAARELPMLCANPDLTMFGAKGLIPAPGALARFYETLGGQVTFVGKPHRPIFTAALERLGHPAPARVLMIGDSLDHDIAGARAAGMLTLFLRAGVHRDRLVDDRSTMIQGPGGNARAPNWTMKYLAW